MTVQAEKKDCSNISEPDDDFYCDEFDWSASNFDKESVDELCDASEDYAKNPENCKKAYNLADKAEEKDIKDTCDKAGGKMNKKGECETDHDGPIADKFHELQDNPQIEDWKNTVASDEIKQVIPSISIPELDREDWEEMGEDEPDVSSEEATEQEVDEQNIAESNDADETNDEEEEQDDEEEDESDEQEEESDDGDSGEEESSEE